MDLLRHLRFFTAVAEERHYGHAAAALGMTQPPLSQGVQRLEKHLGVRLFDRDARGVRITEAGAALLPRAEELLAAADELVQRAVEWAVTPSLRVGLAADLEGRVPELVRQLAEQLEPVAPAVAGSVELVDRVRAGDLDLAVVRHPGVIDGTRAGAVHMVPTRLVVPDDGPDPGAEGVRIAEVARPLVVPPRRHQPAAHDQLVDSLRRAGHSGEVVEEADPLARQALVSAGVAVRLTPDPGSGRDLAGAPLPLLLRVVLPVPAARRKDVDHERAAHIIEQCLS
ncbi:LysR family transcriptional regulator [Nocardioides sp. TF02-7]|uniref:LysR family transcriptional regulator n=1 Tax=Nocardioides sp. TF02-7 TaxID=2917724 RepID=UPI001F06BDF0|nr:LysR family transcriptional regulator [Nocardioides sp. TF02-7]UMG91851.1 LysR family transcriptional regulator [Nocardioides sp. TF02-7]